jgi:arylsulfatase A-like enzyme
MKLAISVLRGVLLGMAVGLAAFALEAALVGSASNGLTIDTEGPFAALMKAVRPALPELLFRVGLVYAVAGASLGAVGGVLAALWKPKHPWLVLAGELLGLWLLLAWEHAIRRPALFDDLPVVQPLLAVLVQSGRPWHVSLAWLLLGGAHLFALARRLREEPARLKAVATVAGLWAVALLASAWSQAPSPGGGRLFLLIGVDALRPDRLAAAPNISAFVKDATLYTRAYTPIAQTEPAWRSLVTERWPNVAGSRYPLTAQSRWPPLPTFPARFQAWGFETYFETDCSRFNYQDEASGFAHRRQPPRGALNFALEKLRFRGAGLVADNALGAWLIPEWVENRAVAGIYEPVGYSQRLARRIVEAAGHAPTLYAFHSTAAHFPGDPVYPFYRRYVRSDAALSRRLRMVFSPITGGAKDLRLSAQDWGREDSEALYDELIAQGDLQVGTILQALKDAGLYDDAYVVLFSDHGESFHADSPQLQGSTPVHGARLGDEENRILLAVKPGRAAHPAQVDTLVRLIDIGPTLLEAAGLAPLPKADGVPLGRPEPRLLYAETGFTHASPAAFDARHLALAPRTFDAYRVRADGIIEMTEEAHVAVLKEKDFGSFDGEHWLVRSPLVDGSVRARCEGNCEGLAVFLDRVQNEAP